MEMQGLKMSDIVHKLCVDWTYSAHICKIVASRASVKQPEV